MPCPGASSCAYGPASFHVKYVGELLRLFQPIAVKAPSGRFSGVRLSAQVTKRPFLVARACGRFGRVVANNMTHRSQDLGHSCRSRVKNRKAGNEPNRTTAIAGPVDGVVGDTAC